jgi:hypothetical protein
VIAIFVSGKGSAAFDPGWAAQNTMLAAWNERSAPVRTEYANPGSLAELFGLEAGEQV